MPRSQRFLLALRLFIVFALFVAAVAFGGTKINPANRFEFTNCPAGGSTSQTITGGLTYLFRVTDEDIYVCHAATCVTGGERYGMGFAMLQGFTEDTTISCRSAGATGDAIYTQAIQVPF